MEREAQNRLLAGVGIFVAIGGLLWFLKKRLGHGRPHEGSITVRPNGTDVSYDPETFTDVSRGDIVLWRLKNESSRRVEVCVTRFVNETTGENEDPLEDLGKEGGKCRRLHGGGRGTIPTKVRGSATLGTYKYSIYLDGREAVDPRLAIVD